MYSHQQCLHKTYEARDMIHTYTHTHTHVYIFISPKNSTDNMNKEHIIKINVKHLVIKNCYSLQKNSKTKTCKRRSLFSYEQCTKCMTLCHPYLFSLLYAAPQAGLCKCASATSHCMAQKAALP